MREVVAIAERDDCSLLEACVEYCEANDLEPEELVEWLEPVAKSQLRQSALDTNKVRKSVEIPAIPLVFE